MKQLFTIVICLTLLSTAALALTNAQDDTVRACEAITTPVIDGAADDACWADATWQPIDQLWIPWSAENTIPANDFTGRYKVTWSAETDKIYFLVEVVDDVLVDGYKYPMDGYYKWDVVEIFFDEDASRGDHTLNQNAFAYHITAGNDEDEFEAMDLAANWSAMNYSHHLDVQIENTDGVYIWEIEMTVYNEHYEPGAATNPTEELFAGKVSGLSIAYCDNDDPNENPKTRDNFFGSVEVPESENNSHWENADWFGTLKLEPAAAAGVTADQTPRNFALLRNYPNPFNPSTTIEYSLDRAATVNLTVYNPLGQVVQVLENSRQAAGIHHVQWLGVDAQGLPVQSGLYFYQLTINGDLNQTLAGKMILAR